MMEPRTHCYYCTHYARAVQTATRGVCCITDLAVWATDSCPEFRDRPHWIKMREAKNEGYYKPSRCD